MPRSLTVVVPHVMAGEVGAEDARESLLARIAGRGSITRPWRLATVADARLFAWQRGLIAALGLTESLHPSAPLAALGSSLPHADDWLHADPISLSAGLTDFALMPLHHDAVLTREDRDALADSLREPLTAHALQLHTTPSGHWLIGAQSEWNIESVSSDFARSAAWNVAQPVGEKSGVLRRLMTELQMVLHEHPVNEARVARGLPIANAVWLWGSGRVQRDAARATTTCVGDNEYLRGVAALHGWPPPMPLNDLDAVLQSEAEHVIVVLNPMDLTAFDAQWLPRLIAALKSGRRAKLQLVLDEWQVTVDRWQMKQFWRRALPVAQWVSR